MPHGIRGNSPPCKGKIPRDCGCQCRYNRRTKGDTGIMARSDWRSRLRDAVNSSGLTRAEIARRAGLNATALRDILDRGKTPSVDNLARIVRVLNLSLGKVYDGDIIGRIQLSIS